MNCVFMSAYLNLILVDNITRGLVHNSCTGEIPRPSRQLGAYGGGRLGEAGRQGGGAAGGWL